MDRHKRHPRNQGFPLLSCGGVYEYPYALDSTIILCCIDRQPDKTYARVLKTSVLFSLMFHDNTSLRIRSACSYNDKGCKQSVPYDVSKVPRERIFGS